MKYKIPCFVGFMLVFFLFFSGDSEAQCKKLNWPENRILAEEKVALYGDALKQKKYAEAVEPLQWMFENAPTWNVKLYIDGAKVYDKLAKDEKDPVKKNEWIESMLVVYDMRIKNCGDESNVINRKAFASYKYNVTKKDKIAEVMELFDDVLERTGVKINDGNLVAYMTTVKAKRVLLKDMSDEEILSRYDKIISVLDKKVKQAMEDSNTKKIEKYKKYRDIIDGLLVDLVKVDCAFVKENLASKFRTNPDDVGLAKKIFGFMLHDKCTDDPLWLEAAETIHRNEKDYGLCKAMALKYMGEGNLKRTENLFKEALQMCNGNSDNKAEMLINLGSLQAKRKDKKGARTYFLQAASLGLSGKKGYEKLGDLYYGSFSECSQKKNMAQDRLVYIMAYNMYQKASHYKKMTQAKLQFPSKEDIFLLNWKIGDVVTLACWINKQVTVATRD